MRYFHGTRLYHLHELIRSDSFVLDVTISPGEDRKFYFFKRFTPVEDVAPYFSGRNAAASWAYRRAKKHDDYPVIISGEFEGSFEIHRNNIGFYVYTKYVPIDKIFIGKKTGLAWLTNGLFLLDYDLKRLELSDHITREELRALI
ncbi:MAG: hypothetical protein WC254_07740 [Candidatus Woesearchaeota archaeon]|jgi:hypothetical protein